MKKLFIFLLILVNLSVYGQDVIGNRIIARQVLLLPADTTNNKATNSLSSINGVTFIKTPTKWLAIATDTSTLSNRINLKLNISDTASMLTPYARTANVPTYSAGYGLLLGSNIFKADSFTVTSKAWHQKGIDSVQSNINLKRNIADTVANSTSSATIGQAQKRVDSLAANYTFQNLTVDPTTPPSGKPWLNTTSNKFKVWINGAATNIATEGYAVPYTGATGNVDLGSNNFSANKTTFSGVSTGLGGGYSHFIDSAYLTPGAFTGFFYGSRFMPKLTASLAGQTLIGLDVFPTFVSGSYSPTLYSLRVGDGKSNTILSVISTLDSAATVDVNSLLRFPDGTNNGVYNKGQTSWYYPKDASGNSNVHSGGNLYLDGASAIYFRSAAYANWGRWDGYGINVGGITVTNNATFAAVYYQKTNATDANYVVTATDYYIILPAITLARTVTLPTASSNTGRALIIVNTNTSANAWTYGAAITLADGTTTTAITNARTIKLFSDGTVWRRESETL